MGTVTQMQPILVDISLFNDQIGLKNFQKKNWVFPCNQLDAINAIITIHLMMLSNKKNIEKQETLNWIIEYGYFL